MTDLNKEMEGLKLPAEEEILGENEGREEALKVVDKEKKVNDKKAEEKAEDKKVEKEKLEEEKEEEKLPKLSAAEFRAYNSMAEHMEYFVSFPLIVLCQSVTSN